jgi:hypothetical protein
MIQGFSDIIQQDIATIQTYFKEKGAVDEEQQRKITLVTIRMFAVLGMAASALMGLRAFTVTASTLGALFKLGVAVAFYALNHDVFVMTKNSEKGLLDQAVAAGKGLFADFKDLIQGDKDVDDAPRHHLTEGTFYRPLWDAAIAAQN